MSDAGRTAQATDGSGSAECDGVRCDFCGDVVGSVHRIALDGDYERLRTRHEALYACADCSAKKERRRLGLERG